MNLNIQPTLQNDRIKLIPLEEKDFEAMYIIASDPKIWEQHPSKDRWKRDVFRIFFDGALQSGGAFAIIDKTTGIIIGSTRFYDYSPLNNSIFIGYTFYGTPYWGKGINHSVKKIMLDYIFQFVSKVHFHIGAENKRSQIAISRINAEKINEQEVTYFGESQQLNFVYEISKDRWYESGFIADR